MQQFGAETEQEQYNTKVKENSRQLNLFRWRTSPPNRSLFYFNIQMSCGRISFCLPFFVQALNLHDTSLLFSRAEPGGRQAVRQNNGLELRLHKLKFVELLRAGERLAAVQYARQHFPTFVSGQEREVQSLMGAVMYSGPGLEQSPYSHLLSPANWQETADLFLRDACALLGLSMESPLTVAVTAGCKALPAHLNI